MRVAVVGSRGFAARWKVEDYIHSLPSDATVITGGAGGVDTWALAEAQGLGLATELYQADWGRYGKKAGPMRNTLLVSKSDRVVAFWDGVSRGTKSTIDIALRSGVDLEVRFA